MFYVVNIQVQENAEPRWLSYMRGGHIQEVVDTGCFERGWLLRDAAQDEQGWKGWRCIYHSRGEQGYIQYRTHFAEGLQQDHQAHFGHEEVKAYRTLLPVDTEYVPQPAPTLLPSSEE